MAETLQIGRIYPVPHEVPDPVAPDWLTALNQGRAQGSFAPIEAWYAANTGIGALGLTEAELTPGSLSATAQGQVIEERRGSSGRQAFSDVTIRGCLFEWSSSLYGAYTNPTFGAPYTNIVYEYCTFVGPATSDEAKRAAIIDMQNGFSVTFRYCQFIGGTSGVANQGGGVIEYCWIHDLAAANSSNEAHRTSLRTSQGGDGRFYRNYCTDGGSSCISIYFDKGEVNNFTCAENIMNGSSPNASPSYLINMKDGPYGPTSVNCQVINNWFGPLYQFGQFNSANVPWGTNGNVLSGNRDFLTGAIVP